MTATEAGVVVLFLLAFAAMWIGVLSVLNSVAKLTRGLRALRGEPLRSSGWGSATINGVNGNGCVKIDEYGDGYLVRLMPIFGGGGLFLPRGSIDPDSASHGRGSFRRSITLVSGEHTVVVYGDLAGFLERR